MRSGRSGRIAASAKRSLLRRTTRAARDSSRVRVLGSERRGGGDDLMGFLELGFKESFSRIEESIFALDVEVAMAWTDVGVREDPLPPIVTNAIDIDGEIFCFYCRREEVRRAFAVEFSSGVKINPSNGRRVGSFNE